MAHGEIPEVQYITILYNLHTAHHQGSIRQAPAVIYLQ